MTTRELRTLGAALYGARAWQTRLAEALEVDARTVRRWVKGDATIPKTVAVAVRCLAREVTTHG